MATPQTGTIYTLTDPRDGRIRYVGKTKQDPLERLAGHLASASNPAMRVWLHALALQGMTPRIDPIVTPPLSEMDAEEQRQINKHASVDRRVTLRVRVSLGEALPDSPLRQGLHHAVGSSVVSSGQGSSSSGGQVQRSDHWATPHSHRGQSQEPMPSPYPWWRSGR